MQWLVHTQPDLPSSHTTAVCPLRTSAGVLVFARNGSAPGVVHEIDRVAHPLTRAFQASTSFWGLGRFMLFLGLGCQG